MAAADRMDVQIKAHDQASMVLGKIAGKFGATTQAGLAMGVAMAGVTLAMQVGMQAVQALQQWIGESIKKFREFEDAMAEVNTMLSSSSQKYLPEMRVAIEELSVKFGKSATDMARGMYQVLSASVEASKAVRFLGVAAKAATAGLTTVESAVDALTTVINAYGLQAEDAAHISDIMFLAVKRGKLRFEDLSNAMGYVVPIAAQAGVSFEEVAAAMATMTKQGIRANMAARALRMTITNIMTPSTEAADAAAKYGVTLDGLHLSIVGLTGIAEELNEQLGGNKLALAELFPNVRALSGVMALMANDARIYTKDITAMFEESGGASSKAALKIIRSGGFAIKAQQQVFDKWDRQDADFWEGASRGWSEFVRGIFYSTQKALMGLDPLLSEEGAKQFDILEKRTSELRNMDEQVTQTEKELAAAYIEARDAIGENGNIIEQNIDSVTAWIKANETLNESLDPIEIAKANVVYNDTKDVMADVTAEINNQASSIAEWEAKEALLYARLNDLKYSIPKLRDNIVSLKAIEVIESDMYAASISLKQLGINVNYSSDSVRNMIETLNNYQVVLDNMTDSQDRYNLSQKETSLEILKIQRRSMDRRGRLTRNEKQMIKELEKKNADFRIAQMSGDIEMQKFKDKYYDGAKKDYDDWVATQQHNIHKLQDTRNKEIETAKHNLDVMLANRVTYTSDLEIVLDKEKNLYLEHYRTLASLRERYQEAGVTVPSEVTTGITTTKTKMEAPYLEPLTNRYGSMSLATGTDYVPQTGIYQLHKGEAVTPAQQNKSGAVYLHVEPITINANISSDSDVESLVQKIETAIQSGLISGITTGYD